MIPEPPAKTESSSFSRADYEQLARQFALLREQLRRVIIGQHEIVELLLISLFCQGHCLLVGVPGLAKTLMVRSLARSLNLEFHRIQFTPDMMPADVLGTELIQTHPETGERTLRFVPGPVFANIVLADEINRTPPRTQAALLEAMAEHQVTIARQTRLLLSPFVVVATQNPIEQEGTYPLPEAQLDRFMLSLWMTYPARPEERIIIAESERFTSEAVTPMFDQPALARMRAVIGAVPVSDHVIDYALNLVRATRPDDPTCPAQAVRPYVAWGAGPRAGQALLLGARCRCLLYGRPTPSAEDIRALVVPVLKHRIVTNYAAIGEHVSVDDLITRVLEAVGEPQYA